MGVLNKLLRWLRPQPSMTDLCKCGHLFEEHDWGAYKNLRTLYSAGCLVGKCQCEDYLEQMRVMLPKMPTIKSKMDWINVKDRLPAGKWSKNHPYLSEEVLIANSCSLNVGFYDREDGIWYVDEPIKYEQIDKITHWMPLPQNPHERYLRNKVRQKKLKGQE